MKDTLMTLTAPNGVRAILEGGPSTIPLASRTQLVNPLDEKIKLPYYGGYEHFERVGWLDEDASTEHLIFRWVARTKIAE